MTPVKLRPFKRSVFVQTYGTYLTSLYSRLTGAAIITFAKLMVNENMLIAGKLI